MKPPSLTDDESAAGSVWLHSKAGPDMADLAEGEQPPAADSEPPEQPDDTDRTQNATQTEGGEGGESGVAASNSTAKLCNCVPLGRPADVLALELVNGSVLTEALAADSTVRTRSQPAICLLVLFYGRSCPFSAAAAPHLNALPRVFPDLRVLAVDALENGSLNTRFGIIAVPTVLLFHNGRPVARYNQSEPTLERLAEFISSHTLLSAGGPLEITDADLAGPLPTVAEHRLDWYLVAAWLFIIVCVACAATRLRLWRRAADTVRAWWLEAEQHLHEE
ncbi:Thioredoxin domain-containing protein 15 [Amphibalanus amphitrite]|uniref:Thioredoxin domain-containing protein 15 n=2 Tax=Amphibalanus amphitrite TaxID=1232801 RepID=A0A6A4WJ33_AMPAM|nr:Thioredoxin domain-containing protein 15 [Amphibalanus amphitrite]